MKPGDMVEISFAENVNLCGKYQSTFVAGIISMPADTGDMFLFLEEETRTKFVVNPQCSLLVGMTLLREFKEKKNADR